MKTLTQICESFRLRRERKRFGEFIESNGGLVYVCTTSAYPPWYNHESKDVSLTQSGYGSISGSSGDRKDNEQINNISPSNSADKGIETETHEDAVNRAKWAAMWGVNPDWEPIGNFGINGPGYGRVAVPGLVERQRLDDHPPFGPHFNKEMYSIFNDPQTKPISNEHCKDLKKYLK